MIVRTVEICPVCGQWSPWRKVSSRIVNGRRRVYVTCRRCGRKETVEYRLPASVDPAPKTFLRS